MTATVIRLLRASARWPGTTIDLPPCRSIWPGGCYDGGDHTCWTWTGWPHVCRCPHCAGGAR